MPESDDRKDLDGLARSIDALFSPDEAAQLETESGAVAEPPAAPDVAVDGSVDAPPVVGASADAGAYGALPPADAPAEEAPGSPPPPDDDVVWAPEGGAADEVAGEADAAALSAAVDLFLSGAPREHEGLAREVRVRAAAFEGTEDLDPVVDAVQRLVLAAGEAEDDQTLGVARSILTPSVAARLALRLSSEQDERHKADTLASCKRLGDDMIAAFREGLSDTGDRRTRRASYDALIAMGEAARDVIEAMVDDEDPFLTRNAVSILGEIGGERAEELVTSGLAHPDARIRREALRSLAKLGAGDVGPLVIGMLEDPDRDVRVAAAMAAGELKLERALRPLLALLNGKPDPDLQLSVLRSLGQLGDPGAVNTIEKHAAGSFFSKPPSEVRIAAYRALHHIGTPRARKLLTKAVHDKDPEVRAEVMELVTAVR